MSEKGRYPLHHFDSGESLGHARRPGEETGRGRKLIAVSLDYFTRHCRGVSAFPSASLLVKNTNKGGEETRRGRKLLVTILFCVFCFVSPHIRVSAQTPYTISTVAGLDSTYSSYGFSQYSPFSGDGGPATAAGLSQPRHAIADAAGNIYIADSYHNTVRKVDTAGIITRIAGNGSGTGLSVGVPATVGNVVYPLGLAFDRAGDLYFNSSQYEVVKIDSAGILTLIAGSNIPSFLGDGGSATAAYLSLIRDITFDGAGNLYIVDQHRVRKVDTLGIITTIAGTGSFGFSGDGGPATVALLSNPMGVAADAVGNIYIGDMANFRVRKINTSGIITTIAGNGSTTYTSGSAATATGIPVPGKLAVDAAGNVFVACGGTAALACKIDPAGIVTTIAGTGSSGFNGDGCNATTRQVYNLQGLSLDNAGNIYLADAGMHRIRKLTSDKLPKFTGGRSQSKTLCLGAGADTINTLLSIIDSDVSQSITWSVASGPAHGTLSGSYSGNTTGGIVTPTGMYYTPTGGYTGNDSFKIRGVDCAGAADTTTIYVNIVSSVSGVAITGASTLCEGTSATLSTSLGGGIWSSSMTGVAPVGSASGIVSGISAGSATITYSLSLSCGSSTVYHTITINPLPSAISGTVIVCASLITTLASSTSGGVWGSGSTAVATIGSTSGVVSGIAGGVSVISYTLPTGCIATKAVTVNPLPGAITGAGAVCMGGSAVLTVTIPGGVWISGSTGVATIGSVSGIVTPVSVGTATITYTLPTGCIATKSITVNPLPLPIGIGTGAGAVCIGGSASLTMTTGGGAWSASNAHATIGSASGVVTGITAGIDTIAYTLPTGCFVNKIITVNPLPASPVFTGPSPICEGSNTSVASGSAGGVWSSSSTVIAIVGSSSGTVTGIGAGVANITYILPTGCVASVQVTVLATPAAITGVAGVCIGSTTTLTNTTGGGTWTSGATSIATVSGSTGSTITVNGIYAGTAVITYTLTNGCAATRTVTVHPLPPAITGYGQICAATTTTLYNFSAGGTWSSALPGTATAGSASGIIMGVATGTATISYTLSTGCATTTVVTVEPSPTPIAGSDVVCISVPDTFSNTVTGGAWASSDYGVAFVDAGTGVVIGLGAGVATISYTLGSTGCYRTKSVTVSPAPTAITGAGAVCSGNSATLTNAVPGGTWTSGATGIATINPTTGAYTGVAAGVATMSYSIGTGCVVTRNVTVNPLPGAITGTTIVCAGATTMLSTTSTGGSWSSSNAGVASIGAGTGIVTGGPVSSGTIVTITYTLPTTCKATTAFAVNPVPGPITGAGALCSGNSAGYSVTGGMSGSVWTSSAPGIATVSGSTALTMTLAGVAAGTATITYTIPSSCYSTKTVTVNALPTAIIGASTVCIGSSVALSTGSTGGTWSRSNTNVNIGSSSGTVTGVASGTTAITYTLPTGCYTTKTITVGTSGGSITGAGAVCIGGSTTLTGSGSGTWTSSTPTMATIGSTTGFVSGIAAGVTTISFTPVSGCVTTKTLTVNGLAAVHNVTGGGSYCAGSAGLHVGLDGSAAGVTYQLYRGTGGSAVLTMTSGGGALDFGVHTSAGTYTVTATNTTTGCTNNMSGSATISINPLPAPITGATTVCSGSSTTLATGPAGGTWSSSNTVVATIGSSTGVVNGLTIGSTVITYTLPTTCSVTTTVNVSTAPTAITGAGTVCTGAMTVLASTPSGGLWSSSNAARATVNSTSGEVTGVGAGTVTITYSLGTGCTVTKNMTVMPSPAAITGAGALCAGSSTMLSTTTSGGTWSSSTTGIATVTSTGTVNGVTAGMAVISYTADGCSTITIVTVNPVPAAIGGPAAVCVGGSVTETNTITGGLWSTTSANINIGSSIGVVTGVAAGTAGITYAIGSCTVTRTITVNTAPTISGAGGVCVGSSATLTVTPTSSGTWSSSSMTTATVSGTGVVAGVNPGVATITFTPTGGCAATKAITVNTAPTTITGTKSVCVDANTTLGNGAGGGVWSSGSTLIATINSTSGEVTGWVPGTANITYSLGTGCAVTAVVTVNPLPSAITGTAVMCVGSTTVLSSGTAGGVWSSGSTGVATVGGSSATMTVSGVAIGTATISYTNPSSGCSATRTVTVTAVPDAISGANAVCMGSTTILSNTTLGGTWTSSNPIVAAIGSATGVVSGVNTGSAVITYSLGPGCTVTKVMTVNPIPAGISGASAICKGSSTTLTTSAAGGTWVTSGGIATVGSSSGVVTGVSGGAATISYTMPTGCASTYTLSVVAVPAIGGIHNMCAWGDTMTVTNGLTMGSYSSALATVMNLGGGVGLVTAHSPGTATITYTIAGLGCSTTSTITVNPLPGIIGGPVDICAGGTGTMVNFTLGGTWSSSAPTVATIGTSSGAVAAIAGGTSTIVYTLPTGCKVDTVITVSTFPVAGTITGAGAVCGGETSVLTMTGGSGSGVWNSSDAAIATVGGSTGLTMTVTGISAGTATVTYTVTNVCGTAKAMKAITVNATPSSGVITGADSVCVGGIVVLSNTATGGVWSMAGVNAAVTSTGILSGLIAGVDTVYYTVTEAGCSARAVLPVRVLPITECGSLGVSEISDVEIMVYPNPNGGEFTIKGIISGMANEDVSIEVINMLGQKIYSRVVRLQDGKLDAEILMVNIANGTYLLNVSSATYRDMFHITITR